MYGVGLADGWIVSTIVLLPFSADHSPPADEGDLVAITTSKSGHSPPGPVHTHIDSLGFFLSPGTPTRTLSVASCRCETSTLPGHSHMIITCSRFVGIAAFPQLQLRVPSLSQALRNDYHAGSFALQFPADGLSRTTVVVVVVCLDLDMCSWARS